MKRRLITSALPYVNNVPHLGNLIQVLSADVFARFCRLRCYDTLYICGTDEYGTATETKALEEGVTPAELCGRFHEIHKDIYEWFGIAFDKFGRTSTPRQTEIVQSIFADLDKAGFIKEQTIEQLFCNSCSRFLADRFVKGTCPHCGYADARGDQCESCGKLLDPTELKEPRCSTCESAPAPRSTKHLYIDLPGIRPKLEAWMKEASVRGFWANNAIQMTQAWIRDGLRERAITRDLKWGIPVPKDGFRDKVFYVWFDAPIGYISITACLGDEKGFDWKSWWMNPREVELYQFIGKDNIPFHTVIFPSSLIGSGRTWTLLHHMSSTEYLNYESGKFSKSKGIGVFGNDAMESGIPADVWRFYIFYNRPEKSDVTFTWKDFQEKVNSELIGNLGNLVNRTLTFVNRFYDGVIPEAGPNEAFWSDARRIEREITEGLDRAELRESLHSAFALSALANKAFQDCEPWKARTENPAKAATLIRDLCYVLRDLAIIMHPYLPASAAKVAGFFGKTIGSGGLDWSTLGKLEGLDRVLPTEVLFAKLEDDQVNALRERHAGSQSERQARDDEVRKSVAGTAAAALVPTAGEAPKPDEPKPFPWADLPVEERFGKIVRLRVATIASITRHTKADKLYIETLDDGSGTERVIVSGLVPFYGEEELLGKRILIVDNLKSARLRGVESRGMLLAAEATGADGTEIVEVLDVSRAANGDIAVLEGLEAYGADEIDVDAFFSVPLRVEGGCVMVGTRRLTVDGEPVMTSRIVDGGVH